VAQERTTSVHHGLKTVRAPNTVVFCTKLLFIKPEIGSQAPKNKLSHANFWLARNLLKNIQERDVTPRILNRNRTIRSIRKKGIAMKNLNNQLKLAAAITLALASLGASSARAEDAKPEHEVSYNAAVTTDYRYRGISQSRLEPALQGGADYVHNPSGFYVGTWASTIHWIKDSGGDGNIEWDIYGGKRGEIAPGISYDVGGLYYLYPSNSLPTSANTFEIYGQIGYGPATLKYSHSTTNLFGFPDSKNSGYFDASANLPVAEGLVLNLHVGHQKVKENDDFSYTDFKVGVTKDFGVCSVALAAIYADTKAYVSPSGKNLGRTGVVLSVSKTF
jgi:uncharacterized protein (TIGR02001 family)